MRTVVIGSGSWGTALAQVLQDNHQEVLVYGVAEAEVNDINENHKNSKYFGDVELNPELKATTDIQCVKGADIVLLAVPTIAIDPICHQINDLLDKKTIIINVSKGFHPETNERMSEVIRRCIDEDKLSSVVSLIGPSHAEEVSIAIPTALVIASKHQNILKMVQDAFVSERMRIYTSNDVKGVELGGALKNIIAFCSGAAAGIGLGDNSFAALITRGLKEIVRLGVELGGKEETFYGLSGLGDLIVTCLSEHSRNRKAGYLIGQGKSLEETKKEVGMVIESIDNIDVAYELGKLHNIEMPIVETVYRVLYESLDPQEAVKDLMTRDKKME